MFTFQQQAQDGVIMWGGMAGQHSHSTRAELAALFVAMIRPKPLHIATASQAMIDKAEK